jgi:hypothetical protein
MTVEHEIQSRLSASPGITALVPPSRIRTPGEHVQLADPYIIHHQTRGRRSTLLTGELAALRGYDYAVTVYDRTIAGAQQIANAVIEAIAGQENGVICIVESSAMGYDADTRLYSLTVEVRVFLAT